MSSNPKAREVKNHQKPVSKSLKPNQPLKFKNNAKSPLILSPSKVLRAIKSQRTLVPRFNGKKNKGIEKFAVTLKINEEKVQMFHGDDPSPISGNGRSGFYSITQEEFDEFGVFLKHLK
jgi:hypothetical protein